MSFNETDFIPLQNQESLSIVAKRPKRADALANRALILETAERLFAERGIANVKMVTIAEAAGVGQGTLYRAFANKGELCLALMDKDLRDFQEEILRLFRAAETSSALQLLEIFLDKLIYFLDCHTALMCETQNYDIFGDELNYTGLHTWFHHTIGHLLRRAGVDGEIRAGVDIVYVCDAILAPLNPILFTHQRRELGFSLEKISRELRRLVLEGIRANP